MPKLTVKEFIENKLRETKREGIEELIKYLNDSDFFVAPASTRYHGCYEGGLAEHCVNVYDCLVKIDKMLNEEYGVPEEDEDSIIISALLHDLCKVNTYIPKQLWRKDENGKWVSYDGWEKKSAFPMGHGSKSVFMAQTFIKLRPVEAQAIFWHMGPYDTSEYHNCNEMGEVFSNFTLAYKLFSADMMATYVLENQEIKWEE